MQQIGRRQTGETSAVASAETDEADVSRRYVSAGLYFITR